MTDIEALHDALRRETAGAPPRGDGPPAPVVTIIGGGYSGTATAIKLMATAPGPLRIGIVEARTELGRGLAYSTREVAHLMNGPAKTFSLHPDRPEHFSHFLARFGRDWGWRDPLAPDYSNAFAPRRIFGDHVGQELERARSRAAPGVTLEHLVATARDVRREHGRLSVLLDDGRRVASDHVVLAPGLLASEPDLPRNLLAGGLVRPGPLGHGIDADPEGAVIGSDGVPAKDLSAIGPALRGVTWESSTLVELLKQAISLGDRIPNRLAAWPRA